MSEPTNALVKQEHGGSIYQGRPPGYQGAGGRPSIITTELVTTITDSIRGGNYAEIAATQAGVLPQQFHEWMQKGTGENAREPYREFADGMLQACAESEKKAVDAIQARYSGDWKSAAWWLERRFPKRWGKQERLEITTSPDLSEDTW